MPSYIVKATPGEEDFYVVWSTVVDAPTAWGTRREVEEDLAERHGTDRRATDPSRFERADAQGTSTLPSVMDPPWFGWADESFMLHNVFPVEEPARDLPRANLRAFCESLDEQGLATQASYALTELRAPEG